MTVVIKTENLGKQYAIGHRRPGGATLRESLMRTMRGFRQRFRNPALSTHTGRLELFWAIRNINLEVQSGDRVGIIGRNGSGKSTLLKTISRITAPTTGRICIRGRAASLLEVGTGFHPELTGRENIFLNGAVLGMARSDIKKRFDEIVAFAEIERFLDTPVKHYSSGMYVRLAFSVAAHLEAEILLIDEVLAVGDVAFQKKCLGRMSAVAQEGRTILFVSHNLAAVGRLCNRVVLLDQGVLIDQGEADRVIMKYLAHGTNTGGRVQFAVPPDKTAWFDEVGIQNDKGDFSSTVAVTKDFYVFVQCTTKKRLDMAQIAVSVATIDGMPVFVTAHSDTLPDDRMTLMPGTYRARIRIPAHFLNTGTYCLTLHLWGCCEGGHRDCHAAMQNAMTFTIEETGSVGARLHDCRQGVITPLFEWTFE